MSRDELLEKVWDGRVVSDSAIASRIKSARQALGDDGTAQRFIRTVHRQGFRFVAPVKAARAETIVTPGGPDAPRSEAAKPSIAVLPFRLLGDAGPYVAIAEALPGHRRTAVEPGPGTTERQTSRTRAPPNDRRTGYGHRRRTTNRGGRDRTAGKPTLTRPDSRQADADPTGSTQP